MAFTTTNVQTASIGPLKCTFGDWSGVVGDTAGTIGVQGGRVYLAEFTVEDGTGPYQQEIPSSTSTSGSVTTVTAYYQATVTNGRFFIIHK